jgi:hypothetical protein
MLALVPLVLAWGATYELTPTELKPALNGTAGDLFGTAVATSGSLLAVSAPGSHTSAGSVRVYVRQGSDWIQRGGDIVGVAAGDLSGTALALSYDTVVIGAAAAGTVRVFAWKGGPDWEQRGLTLTGADDFGYSVSASGDAIAVGSRSAGTVHVYYWNGTLWTQRGVTQVGTDQFGYSVSFDDPVLAVGSPTLTVMYHWNGTDWMQLGTAVIGGSSVSLVGTMVAVGEPNGGQDQSGSVRVCTWNGTHWPQMGPTLTVLEAGSNLGYSVSLSDGLIMAVGAPASGGALIPGKVVVYDRVGGSWQQRGAAQVGAAGTDFGASVALSGGQLVTGAPQHGDDDTGQVRVYDYATVDGSSSGLRRDAIVGIAIGGAAVAVAGVGLAVHWGC